jgi:hypothetical protein
MKLFWTDPAIEDLTSIRDHSAPAQHALRLLSPNRHFDLIKGLQRLGW